MKILVQRIVIRCTKTTIQAYLVSIRKWQILIPR